MEKKLIYLDKKQIKKLEEEKKETGMPSSELVRRLINKYFEEKESKKSK